MKCKLALLSVALLAACGKASETAAEKMIEAQIAKEGGKAQVDLSGGAVNITTTDASGKTSQMEMGAAKVSEADIGVPFYPGTQPKEGATTRVSTPDGSMVTVTLHSDDAPDKVASFYRDRLKAQSQGKQFTDTAADTSHMLTLADDKANHYTQVTVAKGESQGSDIQIMAHRGTAK
jgi:hypothetical protein